MAGTRTVSLVFDQAGAARARRVPKYLLRSLRGPSARKEMRAARERLLIGSDPRADFQLADPTVSAVHCEILADERGFRVRDLGAKNGLMLDGRWVQEARLQAQDELVIGEAVVRFKVLDDDEEEPLGAAVSFGRLRGGSIRMRHLYDQLERAAKSEASVLLQGETGTGKELAADALVMMGTRRERPLEVVDCARLPLSLAESELFGHEAGAFTGATQRYIGAFERANGGTVFIDEVGELPMALQPRLLRALESRTVRRVGGGAEIPVDIRVISATHCELAREINRGRFRADLYYRLAALEVQLPALREHAEDIPELVAHFLDELPGGLRLPAALLQQLYEAPYPGNVRELRSAVERAALGVEPGPLPAPPLRVDLELPFRVQKERRLALFEREYLQALLQASHGNITRASKTSGLSRVHLYELLRRHGLPHGQ